MTGFKDADGILSHAYDAGHICAVCNKRIADEDIHDDGVEDYHEWCCPCCNPVPDPAA